MKIDNHSFFSFLRLAANSAWLALAAYVCFSMVFHFIDPEIDKFTSFLRSNNLKDWAGSNLLNLTSLWTLLVIVLCSALFSFIGFATGLMAKVVSDKAAETLKGGLKKRSE